jgi:hypothetical protein
MSKPRKYPAYRLLLSVFLRLFLDHEHGGDIVACTDSRCYEMVVI